MKLDVTSLELFLTRVSSYTESLIYTKDVRQIHHYTDLGGLEGIVSRHDLWLTHCRFSNDDEELTHGYGIVTSIIEARRASSTKEKRYLDALKAELNEPNAEPVYICCFCKEGDLLSQWRAYGANGAGVSLAFDPTGFDFITGPDSPPYGLVRLWSVFYRHDTQRTIIEQAIAFGLETGTSPEDRARRAADAIRFFIPTFKNERFEEENEYRLIFTPSTSSATPSPEFRVARGMLIPYYGLQSLRQNPTQSARPLPLTTVRVGPSTRRELNGQAARMLLDKHGYGATVPVDLSTTPYRG